MRIINKDHQEVKLNDLLVAVSSAYDGNGNKVAKVGDTYKVDEEVRFRLMMMPEEKRVITKVINGMVTNIKVEPAIVAAINNRITVLESDGGNEFIEALMKEFPYVMNEIFEERVHQLKKGFDFEHDKENAAINSQCLIDGALYYLLDDEGRRLLGSTKYSGDLWPYIDKPKDEGEVRNLIKAITMLIAHLEYIYGISLPGKSEEDEK